MKRIGDSLHHSHSKRPKSIAESPMISVAIGPASKPRIFRVHEDILVSQSKYFTACLRGGFQEAQNKRVNFYDDEDGNNAHDADMFAVVVNWLYYLVNNEGTFSVDASHLVKGADDDDHQILYVRLYVEVDILMMDNLKLNIAESMKAHLRHNRPNITALKLLDRKIQTQNSLGDELLASLCAIIYKDPLKLDYRVGDSTWEEQIGQGLRSDGELCIKVLREIITMGLPKKRRLKNLSKPLHNTKPKTIRSSSLSKKASKTAASSHRLEKLIIFHGTKKDFSPGGPTSSSVPKCKHASKAIRKTSKSIIT